MGHADVRRRSVRGDYGIIGACCGGAGVLDRVESRVIPGAAVIDDIPAMLLPGIVTFAGDAGVDVTGLLLRPYAGDRLVAVIVLALVSRRHAQQQGIWLRSPDQPAVAL